MALELQDAMFKQAEERCEIARAQMHWHLGRLAAWTISDANFGERFDHHLDQISKWRSEHDAAYAEKLKWMFREVGDHGSG